MAFEPEKGADWGLRNRTNFRHLSVKRRNTPSTLVVEFLSLFLVVKTLTVGMRVAFLTDNAT